MSEYFSYVDTALRIIHINQTIFDEDEEFLLRFNQKLEELETAADVKQQLIYENILFQLKEGLTGDIVYHE